MTSQRPAAVHAFTPQLNALSVLLCSVHSTKVDAKLPYDHVNAAPQNGNVYRARHSLAGNCPAPKLAHLTPLLLRVPETGLRTGGEGTIVKWKMSRIYKWLPEVGTPIFATFVPQLQEKKILFPFTDTGERPPAETMPFILSAVLV